MAGRRCKDDRRGGRWKNACAGVHARAIDGYEVLRWIKSQAKHRNTAVVAVTALAMVGDRDKTLAAGFDGYMAKPISPESFVAEVETFLPLQRRTSDGQRSHCSTSDKLNSVDAGTMTVGN
ncbi:MAG TPA: response regulator [Pirellulales bacterium]|nr:response regulator [Pirellulales bacterium]